MANLEPMKSELRAFLNNGSSSTGAVRTLTMKLADLNADAMAAATTEQLALLLEISRKAAVVLTKSVYYTAVSSVSQLVN